MLSQRLHNCAHITVAHLFFGVYALGLYFSFSLFLTSLFDFFRCFSFTRRLFSLLFLSESFLLVKKSLLFFLQVQKMTTRKKKHEDQARFPCARRNRYILSLRCAAVNTHCLDCFQRKKHFIQFAYTSITWYACNRLVFCNINNLKQLIPYKPTQMLTLFRSHCCTAKRIIIVQVISMEVKMRATNIEFLVCVSFSIL